MNGIFIRQSFVSISFLTSLVRAKRKLLNHFAFIQFMCDSFGYAGTSIEVCRLRRGAVRWQYSNQNFIFMVLQTFIVKRHITWQMCVSVCLNAVSSVENWEVIGSCNVSCCVFRSLLLASIYCITLSSSFGCIPSLFFSSWDEYQNKRQITQRHTDTHTHTRHHIDNGIGSHVRTTFHRFLCLYMCQTLAHRLH